ncbi:MAG: hypothetical protein ACRDS0_23555 [Pseudonocardiaceae bacterium]
MVMISRCRLPCAVDRDHPICQPGTVTSAHLDNRTAQAAASEHVELPACSTLIRRVLKHPHLRHYNRLIALIVISNLAFLGYSLIRGQWWHNPGLNTITIVGQANLTLAIIFRQQHVINLLHWLVTRAPSTWPLRLRWALGKVYHFGGVHVGAAVSGTLWHLLFVGALSNDAIHGHHNVPTGNVIISYALVVHFAVIMVMALPRLRAFAHNRFEMTHRFCGWAAVVLVWANTIVFVSSQRGHDSLVWALLAAPTTWLLLLTTLSILLPWLQLREVPVTTILPSTHVALVGLDHGVTPSIGSVRAISRNPLLEWHSFATIPAPIGHPGGYRMAVSRAGDWTGSFIDDPPKHVWVRGIPTAGMANVSELFTKVVYLATGSGIGPALPHLMAGKVPAHLVWVTRSPRETYGDKLVDEILTVSPDATIWNTDEDGKPDLVSLAYGAYASFGAEPSSASRTRKSPGRWFTLWSVVASRRLGPFGTHSHVVACDGAGGVTAARCTASWVRELTPNFR